jgi:hypothetical protein
VPEHAPLQGVLWVVWDGASFDVVRDLLGRGELPTLRSLCDGRVVPLSPLSPNCQTPPSLASLFTGATIAEHGVTGFRVPSEPAATFVESRSGFEVPVRRPLIWSRVAAEGGWVGLSHVAWGSDAGPGEAPASLAVDAYDRRVAAPGVVEAGAIGRRPLSFELGGRPVVVQERGGVWEASAPATGARVVIGRPARLDLAPGRLRLGPGLGTRLGAMTLPDGRRVLVHTGLWELRAGPDVSQEELDRTMLPFMGKLLGEPYRAGDLGLRAMEGGDGAAEQALAESARWQAESFTRCCELVLRRAPPDGLVIAYVPVIDEVQHELFRWWRAAGDGAGLAGEDLAGETTRRVYALADAHLARLLRHTGPGCAVVLCSDHGAAGVSHDIHVNEALVAAGLTAFDQHGRIDVARSRVAYHPAGNGSVWVNDAGRAGGLVGPDERDGVVEAAERALRAARDPLTGLSPMDVTRVPRAARPLFGDLLVRGRPGYDPRWERHASGALVAAARKGGTHVTPTGETTLRGVLAAREAGTALGPGPEADLPVMEVHHLVERLVAARRRRPRSPA